MLKRDIVTKLHKRFPQHFKKDIEVMVDLIFESMTSALCQGRRIEIRGFGSFAPRRQKGRAFVNPKNGKLTQCPSNCRIVFKPGKDVRIICSCEEDGD